MPMHSYMLRANNYRYRSAQFVSLYPDFTVGTGILPALLKYFCCQHIRIKAIGLVAQTPARITASEEFHLALKHTILLYRLYYTSSYSDSQPIKPPQLQLALI